MAIPASELNLTNAVLYHTGQFPPQKLDFEALMEPMVKATDAIARFDQMLKNMHNKEILLAPLRNQEAVISSRMEGTISTMDEILQYEADHDGGIESDDNTRMEVVETILYQRALKHAQQEILAGAAIDEALIKNLHQRLLSLGRGASKSPGKFKDEQNYLADKTKRNVQFVPISPDNLYQGLEKLFSYIHTNNHPTLIRTAISHVEFEALHPFKDGNGRVGRMLITLMLWNSSVISSPHFYISGYMEEHKNAYIDFMRNVSANNDWTGWCAFFLEAVETQAKRNLQIAENIQSLYDEMKDVFREELASKWCAHVMDFIFANPVFRNAKLATATGIPPSSATKFSKILVEAELLVPVQEASGRRSALYRFEPLMKLVRV